MQISILFTVTEVNPAVSFFFVKTIQTTFTFSDIAKFIALQIFEILLLLLLLLLLLFCQSYVHQSYSYMFLINGNERNFNAFPCNIIFKIKKPCSCFFRLNRLNYNDTTLLRH